MNRQLHILCPQVKSPPGEKWFALRVNPRDDVDRIHGKGIWDNLKMKKLRITLGAWAWEKENNFINGYIDEFKFEKKE